LTPGKDHFEHVGGLGPLLLPVSQAIQALRRPPPLDGCPTYNAAGQKENKIDYRKYVSCTGFGEAATLLE
ncbi:hypothetical protein K7460_29330, partial [Pseudomonas fluorescens]|nr:hypothetical protein [Pseudomonas fluorescens]